MRGELTISPCRGVALSKELFDDRADAPEVVADLVLPDTNDDPAFGRQRGVGAPISLDVPREFRSPVGHVRSRVRGMRWAPVPEAAVHKDREPGAGEDGVRSHAPAAENDQVVLPEP